MGVVREEYGMLTYVISSMLIGMDKRNVLESVRAHTWYIRIFFGHTPSSTYKATQVFVHEASEDYGHFFIDSDMCFNKNNYNNNNSNNNTYIKTEKKGVSFQ